MSDLHTTDRDEFDRNDDERNQDQASTTQSPFKSVEGHRRSEWALFQGLVTAVAIVVSIGFFLSMRQATPAPRSARVERERRLQLIDQAIREEALTHSGVPQAKVTETVRADVTAGAE